MKTSRAKVNPPDGKFIGEIREAKELGYKGAGKKAWILCKGCNKPHWVDWMINKAEPRWPEALCSECGHDRSGKTKKVRHTHKNQAEPKTELTMSPEGILMVNYHDEILPMYDFGKAILDEIVDLRLKNKQLSEDNKALRESNKTLLHTNSELMHHVQTTGTNFRDSVSRALVVGGD